MEDGDFNLLDPRFTDPVAAAEYLESIRWPNRVTCPHCGEAKREPYRLKSKATKRRLWKCRRNECRKQFTVTVGTIFEASHIPLNKWLAAFYLLCSSKKGMSAHQLHRMLGVTYKTAWFMFHRIREAMRDPAFTSRLSGTVEADETYLGGKRRDSGTGRGTKNKTPVMTLVERDGRARSFRMANVTAAELGGVIREHVDMSRSRLMTDEWLGYRKVGKEFTEQLTVAHGSGEYVRGDAHVNTAEGYFANLKRGVNGIYHHVSRAHLDRYLAEFDFRWNARHVSDSRRTIAALSQTEGKRLKYRDSTSGPV
jgi:transposase-like protein